MDAIRIMGTDDTPTVTLDAEQGVYEISGRSLPEDVTAFYAPVLAWLDEYANAPKPTTVFTFKLVYFNTASSKLLLDVLMKLEAVAENGSQVRVKWYYPEDDEDMKEAGDEYADIVDLEFEPISYAVD
jgi:hypothetical protein